MGTFELHLLELLLFFLSVGLIFQAMNAVDLSKIFKKGYVWQIQVLYIVMVIVLSYLLSKALINIIYLSSTLFS